MHEFKGNVVEMIKSIEKHYQAIVDNKHSYDPETYRRHLLSAFLSGSNAIFNAKIQTVKSDVDACYGYNSNITPSSLISLAKQLYINIERRGEWNKVDPKDAQIMALTTALQDKGTATSAKEQGTSVSANDAKMTDDEFFNWRTKFQGKTATRQGKVWTWCPHHKKEGHYDGLYYANHTPETHDAWKAQGKRGGRKITPSTANPSNAGANLQISDALKTALCTNLCLSEEDLAKIVDSAQAEN